MLVLSMSRSLEREGKELSSMTDDMAPESVQFTVVFVTEDNGGRWRGGGVLSDNFFLQLTGLDVHT